jgi:tetratricopeptide (TPR) repeat protein
MLVARLRWITLALLLLAPAPALALGPAAAPGIEQRDRSLAKAKEGLESYRAERWQEAYERFTEAEQLYHATSVVLYLARCQRKLGKPSEARVLYEQILAEPPAENAPLPLIDAYRSAERELGEVRAELAAAQRAPASVAPALDAPAPGAKAVTPTPNTRQREGSLLPGVIALGLGAAGVGIGSITGILTLSKASDLKQQVCPNITCFSDLKSETIALGNVSTGAFIAGGAAVIAGVILVVVRPGGEPKPAASGGAARVEPEVCFRASVGFGRLDLQVRF